MHLRLPASLACVLLFGAHLSAASDWRNLLDEDLTAWEIWMGVPHASVSIPGYAPFTSQDGRSGGEPLGLNADPLKVFSMGAEDGQPVLYISGQIYAGLTSLEEFENYHLSLQFRWGEKRWEPRPERVRDSGLLIHCVGEHGAFWNVWMRSLECQIQENDCGDFFPLAGTMAAVKVDPDAPSGGRPRYQPGGVLTPLTGSVQRSVPNERPHGEWNTIEVYTLGTTSVFVVNGLPNMVLFNTMQRGENGAEPQPLAKGRLQLQSEAAEIAYRDIKIRPLEAFPAFLRAHVMP